MLRFALLVTAIGCFLGASRLVAADKEKDSTEAPAEVIAAWKKIEGARVGWMGVDEEGWFSFTDKADEKAKMVPATVVPAVKIETAGVTADQLAALPKSPRGFGLDLGFGGGAPPKSLAGIKNLTALDLSSSNHIADGNVNTLQELKDLTALRMYGASFTNRAMPGVAKLKNLRILLISPTQVTDDGFKELAALKNLAHLSIVDCPFSNAGLKHLAELDLVSLNLHHTHVTDAGMKHLLGMKKLSILNVNANGITDAGLMEIAKIKTLTSVTVRNSDRVTDAGITKLKKAVPKCRVERER